MLYVDAESIWTDVRRILGEELPSQLRDQVSDFVPQWATLTSSFINNGMKFMVSSPISEEVNERGPKDLSLSAAPLLPKDTLVLLVFAVDPSLDGVREQLGDQRIEDLGPEFYDGLFQLGFGISPNDSWADLMDAALKTIKDAFGVDLERDILDWMSGEFAFALLPINFRALSASSQTEAMEAAVFIQYVIAKHGAVADGLEHLLDSIQEGLGFAPDAVSYGEGEGAVSYLAESSGISPYRPGYLILDDQQLIATTEDTLELAASLSEDRGRSLAAETEYARLVREVPGGKNPLLYVNIREVVESVVTALDSNDHREYEEEVEPFVGPFKALLLAGVSDFEEGLNRFSFILTVE